MFKIRRKEKVVEPEESLIFVNEELNTEMEPKKTFKRNLTVFLGLLTILIIVSTTLYEVAQANQESNVFQPEVGVEQELAQGMKENKEILWQGFHSRVLKWEDKIVLRLKEIGAYQEIDSNAVAALIQIESCGHKHATSESGAMGLGQVMPFHWANLDKKEKYYAYRPAVNLPKAFTIFGECLKKAGGDYYLAFACYNGGPSTLEKDPSLWPDEARRYARWGSGIMNDINSGLETSPTLKEWMDAGGAFMCEDNFQKDLRIKIFGE